MEREMNDTHNDRSFLNRRTLITLVIVLALIQVGIPACRRTSPRPATPQEATSPPPVLQFQWPPASATATPEEAPPTPAPDAVALVAGPPVPATNYADQARMFDEELALEHLAYLASDELGGRQPGTPGGRAAGDYIAARFAEYGLQPAGPDGSYFQTFTVPYGRITELPALNVTLPGGEALDRTYTYRADYLALTGGYLGAGAGEGPVVWLNACLHDDYAGLDMTGKIALCRYTGDPQVYRQAIEHQVGGLLLLVREREDPFFRRGGYRETAWVPRTIPAYVISETVAQDLLLGTDHTLDNLSLRFTATPLSTTVTMAVTLEEQEAIEARNVLALLPGSGGPAAQAEPAQRCDEIVVIGAHYDHLGHEPDGMIVNGANDNASGVATMLEIARLWQAQGYRPARSVLFAAWDGEEQGLLGSRHYVEHPAYPLTRTVAMLNLDMVGAGEALQIDGEGATAAQLRASAQVYGITATLSSMGRSDHVPFQEAGVPAAMFIYWPDLFYHTPGDQVEVVEPQKLKTVGVLSAHALAALAEGHVEVEQAVDRLRASIAAGDREAFLEGIDPADPDLRAAQAAWFDSLWSRELAEVTIRPSRMRVGDGEADVTLELAYRWADASRREPSVSYDARFVQRDDAWVFAGYDLKALSGDVVTVARFPDVRVETRQLLSVTQRAYLAIAADLGLRPITGTRFIYYPDAATMRAIARPLPPPSQMRDGEGWLASSAGLAEIAWGQPITPALVSLALNQMGLPPDEGAWLREGLARHYEGGVEREYLPALVAAHVLTSPLDLPADPAGFTALLSDLPDREAQAVRAQAWSAVEVLLDRYGTAGLHRLCAAWGAPEAGAAARGRPGGPDAVFQEALGLSPQQFESAWRADRLDLLRADARAIQATIAARVEAVLAGDATGFLSTVTPADPVLRAEERNWFATPSSHPVVTYSVAGELVGWSPGGEEAVIALRVGAVISGGQPGQVGYDARFIRDGDRWLYAGVAWEELASPHFVLKYQARGDAARAGAHDEAWARRVLDLAEAAYAQVTADLEATPPLPQEIKVYDSGELFRASVSLSLPQWVSSWSRPGEAIKCWFQDEDQHAVQGAIAYELARQVLSRQGLQVAWLYEGVAGFEAGRVLPLGMHRLAAEYAPIAQEAVRQHEEVPLSSLSRLEDLDLEEDQLALFQAQSWSLVSFIVQRHGLPGLRRLIAQSAASEAGTPLLEASETDPAARMAADLRAALGVDLEHFLAGWREYARVAGVPDDLVALAGRFAPERALAHVATLSSPEFGGREAGAPGADLAAATVARQFAALGLQPAGDPLPSLAAEPGSVAVQGERGYLQSFPISYTHLISVPTLTLLDDDGAVLHEFAYRQDFVEHAGRGTAQGELVWLHTDDLEGMRFGGAVVLERDVDDPLARAAQLQDHGAGGLIVATEGEPGDLLAGHVRPPGGHGDLSRSSAVTIPVFQITAAAFETLLQRLGMEYRDLSFAPPALPLEVQVRQTLAQSPLTTTLTANVLGLLPGSDPDLADEVLLVGAHYDHIGQSPDGLYFPGANRNASGVAALLEMARVWQSAGYRPARSVLFAAWGAEELGSAGVTHYLAHPAVPVTRTVGVIALDSIGNGRGYSLLFYGAPAQDWPLVHRIEAGTAALNRRAQRRVGTGEGWQVLFNAAGIPTAKLIWDDAERDFYLSADAVERIDPERLAFSGQLLTLVSAWLAGE